jgi:hypothetical protein
MKLGFKARAHIQMCAALLLPSTFYLAWEYGPQNDAYQITVAVTCALIGCWALCSAFNNYERHEQKRCRFPCK